MLLDYILFGICCYVLSSIIVQQKIFEEPRAWLKKCSTENPSYLEKKLCQLVSCMFCTGFWAGIFVSFVLGFNPFGALFTDYIIHGLLGAFSSYLLHLIMGLLIKKAEAEGVDT